MKKFIDDVFGEIIQNLKNEGEKANCQEYAGVVQRFLDKIGWRYRVEDYDFKVVHFYYGLDGFKGVYDSFQYCLRVDSRMLKTMTFFPSSMGNRNNIEEIVEFITRANVQLKFGAFKLDFNVNRIYFDITFPVGIIEGEIDTLEEKLNLDLLLTCGAKMFDSYSYGFAKIIMGELTPEEAIRYSKDNR